MTHDILALVAQYGLLLVFANVLLEQAGAPVPAVPTLVVAGALAAGGQLSLPLVVLVAVLASLLSDGAWFGIGRHFGTGVLHTLCRISISPDSCIHRSELQFERWGGKTLLIAKFVPGLSTVAPPLLGALGLRLSTFLVLDGLGALLWAGLAAGLGYVFAAQIDQVLAELGSIGTLAFELVLGLFAVYIAGKWWQRRRLLTALRMPRITVAELHRALSGAPPPLVLDVRSATSRGLDAQMVDGAVVASLEHLEQAVRDVPFDRELVTYCSCPNEVSAARAAQTLKDRGYRHVRPLHGGLAAWAAAGYAVQQPSAGAGGK
jgi:membrane protein DedA with SNARE-associated domain/rhodanese-related sulfurtransferase